MKNLFAAVLCVLAVASCGNPARAPVAVTESARAHLLESAANDFHQHVAPTGAQFRNVHVGVLHGEGEDARNIMCGEFRTTDGSGWVAFATIETDPYENWLGGAAENYCAGPNTALATDNDLSDDLSGRYQSLG
ncbi:MAG: hypothetical protein JNJ63_12295 [Hyphomonadaceae bacterium]|nr:hypothetical protein [Hyphomonadaceae bacterium]